MGVKPLLDAAVKRRAKVAEKLTKLTATPQQEGRTSLTEDEARKFEELAAEIEELDKKTIPAFRSQLEREEAAARAAGDDADTRGSGDAAPGGEPRAHITREPLTYDKHRNDTSFFKDLAYLSAATLDHSLRGEAEAARERLARHGKEVDVEAKRDAKLAAQLRELRATPASLIEQRVNPNTSYGQGGEFVPPLWLVSMYVPFARPGRVFANRVRNLPLSPGIDVINLPKITVGSQAGIQANQGGAVTTVDLQTSTVSAKVNTIAGQEDISLQLLEQSPLSMDGVIWDDLGRDYDQRLDLQVIAGTGQNGQHLGVLAVPGATNNTGITTSSFVNCTSTTFHDSSTSGTQYRSIVNGVNQVETLRYDTPTAIWVSPRRSNSWAYASDSTNRPLFIPAKYGQYNALGTNEGAPVPQGIAGELFGLPVVKDNNMPTTVNGFTGGAANLTGGTQDAVAVLKEDDLILWEGAMRMRALPEILSGTLQIRFQLYAYSAFMPNRFAPSISVIAGAGVAAPGF